MSVNHKQPFYFLFQDIWEYLDFRRQQAEFTFMSPDGLLKATLKQHGGWFSYSLSAGDDAKICTTFDIFRATAVRLRAFHTGCARVALLMRRYLRTGDRKWLMVDRPFGALHGGIVTTAGGYMWRGTKDDIDTDEWIDLVEDEQLARLLHQVDQILNGCSGNPWEQAMRKRAWDLLESVPECHQNHVEVLRRRLQYFCCAEDFQDHASAVRWARKLVEAEPYDVVNWWSLSWAVEKLDGKSASVDILRKGLEHHGPDFTLYYELAALLCALNRLDEAKEAMLLALKEDILAINGSLESETFSPIHDYIMGLKDSDWYKNEKEALEKRYPSEVFDL
jgi:hypothetical protein